MLKASGFAPGARDKNSIIAVALNSMGSEPVGGNHVSPECLPGGAYEEEKKTGSASKLNGLL